MELSVVGSPTFTLGFRLAGVRKAHDATGVPELSQAVRKLLQDPEAGILVMETTDVKRLDPALRRELEVSVRPTLVAIGEDEDTELREKLKQAIGVDLWK